MSKMMKTMIMMEMIVILITVKTQGAVFLPLDCCEL